jgi:hypothetical protein
VEAEAVTFTDLNRALRASGISARAAMEALDKLPKAPPAPAPLPIARTVKRPCRR